MKTLSILTVILLASFANANELCNFTIKANGLKVSSVSLYPDDSHAFSCRELAKKNAESNAALLGQGVQVTVDYSESGSIQAVSR